MLSFNVSVLFQQKTAQTVSSKMGRHLDAMCNSTTAIDFSLGLGGFEINTFPEGVRKLHEEGKLKKLLKQAVGLRQNKAGLSPSLYTFQRNDICHYQPLFQFAIVKLR